MRTNTLAIVAAGLLATATLACTTSQTPATDASPTPGTASPAAEAARDARDTVVEGAEKAGDAIRDAAEAVKDEAGPTARAVGEDVKTYGKAAGDVIDAQKQVLDVRAALIADDAVDASGIDVDVHSQSNTITLRGSVPTDAQKAAAERIARGKAEGYTIVNELSVAGTPAASR